MKPFSRRSFVLAGASLLGACSNTAKFDSAGPINAKPIDASAGRSDVCPGSDGDWLQAEAIVNGINQTQFPKRHFVVGPASSSNDISSDISAAIKRCNAAGGGRVVIKKGEWLTGPIHLLSNVNLHLEKGAVVRFKTDPKAYLPAVFTRWEGMEYMGYSPLIYAYEQNNIAITGEGVLDGQASRENWWPWKANEEWAEPGFPSQDEGREQLMADVEAGTDPRKRDYAQGYYFRPPFIQFYRCQQVLLQGFSVTRSPFWLVNPVLCQDVIVRGLELHSLGPNSDGCNPESCRNVLIEDCYFDTGDDCIAIKSGRNNDGRRLDVASENIVIRNCQMRAGHGGVVIGSEISGGANHIFVENCVMSSPDLERGIRIKTNSIRGGHIHHLGFRNIVIGEVKDALVINFHYEEGDAGAFDPRVEDIVIENLLCHKAQRVFQVRGFGRAPIKNLNLHNCHFVATQDSGVVEYVEGLNLDNVSINGHVISQQSLSTKAGI